MKQIKLSNYRNNWKSRILATTSDGLIGHKCLLSIENGYAHLMIRFVLSSLVACACAASLSAETSILYCAHERAPANMKAIFHGENETLSVETVLFGTRISRTLFVAEYKRHLGNWAVFQTEVSDVGTQNTFAVGRRGLKIHQTLTDFNRLKGFEAVIKNVNWLCDDTKQP